MQRRVNVLVPFSCPHCLTELMPTLDQVQEEESVQCSRCGTKVDLHIDPLPPPGELPQPQDFLVL